MRDIYTERQAGQRDNHLGKVPGYEQIKTRGKMTDIRTRVRRALMDWEGGDGKSYGELEWC